MRIRPRQHKVAEQLLSAAEGGVLQMSVGEGKTRVILPMIVLHWMHAPRCHPHRGPSTGATRRAAESNDHRASARPLKDGKLRAVRPSDEGAASPQRLVRVVLLPELLWEGMAVLSAAVSASPSMPRRLVLSCFTRGVRMTKRASKRLVAETLGVCATFGGALVTTREDVLSLTLKAHELRIRDGNAREKQAPELERREHEGAGEVAERSWGQSGALDPREASGGATRNEAGSKYVPRDKAEGDTSRHRLGAEEGGGESAPRVRGGCGHLADLTASIVQRLESVATLWWPRGAGCDAFDVVDESDSALSHRFRLMYTAGPRVPLPGGRHLWMTVNAAVLALASGSVRGHLQRMVVRGTAASDDPKAGEAGNFPSIRLTDAAAQSEAAEEDWAALAEGIAREVVERDASEAGDVLLCVRERGMCEQAIDVALGREQGRGEALGAALERLRGRAEGPLDTVLLTLRGLLCGGVLRHCLSLRRDVHYGAPGEGQRHGRAAAVPYVAANTPSKRSDFVHPEVALTLTCLTYYARGLGADRVKEAIAALRKLPERQRRRWTDRLPGGLALDPSRGPVTCL